MTDLILKAISFVASLDAPIHDRIKLIEQLVHLALLNNIGDK